MPATGAMGAGAVGDHLAPAGWKTGAGAVRAALPTVGPQTFAPIPAAGDRRLVIGPVPGEHGGPAEGSTDKSRERKSR